MSLNGLGQVYQMEGKYLEAEPRLQAVLEARRHAMGEQHPDTLGSMTDLGLLYLYEGKYTDAEPLMTHAVETSTSVLGEDNPETQRCLGNLGRLYLREGKLKPSRSALERLLKARERTYGPESPFTVSTQALLGEVRLRQGAYSEANPLLRAAVEYYRRHGAGTSVIWRRYYAEWLLGRSLTGPGRNAEGENMLASAGPKLLQREESIPSDYRPILDEVRRWTERATLPRR
jgi:tetratricopeptide (TPR) repeat protein